MVSSYLLFLFYFITGKLPLSFAATFQYNQDDLDLCLLRR